MIMQPLQELAIREEHDIVMARSLVRESAMAIGFGLTDVTRIVTTASELARNAFRHAGGGIMKLRRLDEDGKLGLELTFEDHGPGIPDIELALQKGYTTAGGLGLGLPGTKRMMDNLDIQSELGKGTLITVRKWRKG